MTSTVLKLKLKPFLEANELSAYQLAQEISGVGQQTVYSIVRGDRKPSWESLDHILNALARLVRRPVALDEIVEHEADTVRPASAGAKEEAQ